MSGVGFRSNVVLPILPSAGRVVSLNYKLFQASSSCHSKSFNASSSLSSISDCMVYSRALLLQHWCSAGKQEPGERGLDESRAGLQNTSAYESTTPNPVGLEIHGRRALLAEALAAKSVSAAGFAEARTASRQIVSPEFVMVASGHVRGQLGCGCWIARRFPFVSSNGTVKYYNISPNNVAVFHATPRLLVTCLQAYSSSIYFVVFHAPHAGTGALRDLFLDELEAILAQLVGHTCILLGDANACMGSINSESVGNFPKKQNYNGGRFHSILKPFKLYVPNTFGEFTQGNAVDTHATNRIDYIICPSP